jgi:ABC-2 type transport system permease protein
MSTVTVPDAAAPAAAPPRGGLPKAAADTRAVFRREMLLVLRDPFSLIFTLLQPLVFLGLFGPLLSGTVGGAGLGGGSSLQWFLPGVVVMIALFGTSMTGANLLYEMQTGAFERILASPLDRSAILVGRALKEFAPLVAQALLIVCITIPFGVTLDLAGVLVGLLVLGAFGVGLGSLSYALAIASRNREWLFWGLMQSLLFPLLILSGMLLPLEAGPGWMRALSRVNPLTYLVDAERALFAGTFADISVLWGAIAATLTCAVGLLVGVRSIRRTAA